MKVLVVGFMKAGTTSMCAALRELGFNVYDFTENAYYLGDEWIKIMTEGGTKQDFYRMYKDIDATTDVPACIFWEEILEAFPDAKLIFTQRKSEEIWWESWKRQNKAVNGNKLLQMMACISPTMIRIKTFLHHIGRISVCSPPQKKFYEVDKGVSPTVAKMRYREHNAAIMLRAPKDQLLMFKLEDGWEPLCDFLDLPIPDIPFPHKNKDGSSVDDFVKESPIYIKAKKEMQIFLFVFIAILAIVFALFWSYVVG